MSSLIQFNRKYFRPSVIIQHCFSVERKTILPGIVAERPWAIGLTRLLAERRGLKKGALALLADVRPALISAVGNSSKPPEITSLQRIAAGFTAFDRQHNPHAPEVELWEFFVTDEQAAVLRERAQKTRQASEDEALLARAMQIAADSLKQARAEQPNRPMPQPVEVKPHHASKKKPA